MKKILSWLLIMGVLCGMLLQTAVPVGAAPSAQKQQTLDAMNGLLVGITYSVLDAGNVDTWTDDAISHALCSKILWDGYGGNAWLPDIGFPTDMSNDGYIHAPRSLVDKLVLDTYGRAFVPVEIPYMLELAGDEVLFGVAAGEHTQVVVQDYVQRGNYYVAVGCCAWYGGAGSEVEDYFQAVFRQNSDSMYGMTLVSLEKISGNQSFRSVSAEASSVLSGGNYKAANALDGSGSTAWVEGAAGTGTGEFMELYTTDGSALDLIGLEIDPGYHKSNDILTKNGWPTRIRVETEDGVVAESYCYSTDTQVILFDIPTKTQWMRLTIVEAQAGTKYTDTCISEIRLKGMDTEAYFRNLDIDLPEETVPATTAPAQQPDAPAPDTEASAPAETTTSEATSPEEQADAPDEEEDTDTPAASDEDKDIISLSSMGGITEFISDNLLLVILICAGLLIVAAGIALLLVILKKKN